MFLSNGSFSISSSIIFLFWESSTLQRIVVAEFNSHATTSWWTNAFLSSDTPWTALRKSNPLKRKTVKSIIPDFLGTISICLFTAKFLTFLFPDFIDFVYRALQMEIIISCSEQSFREKSIYLYTIFSSNVSADFRGAQGAQGHPPCSCV